MDGKIKKNPECCGCYCCYRLASQDIWGFHLPEGYQYLESTSGVTKSDDPYSGSLYVLHKQ